MNEMSRVDALAEAGERAQDPVRDAGAAADLPLRARLGTRSVVLVGLMGAGKSTVGRRLAQKLGLPFRDADHEIEVAAGMTIPDIFAIYGEAMGSHRPARSTVQVSALPKGGLVEIDLVAKLP